MLLVGEYTRSSIKINKSPQGLEHDNQSPGDPSKELLHKSELGVRLSFAGRESQVNRNPDPTYASSEFSSETTCAVKALPTLGMTGDCIEDPSGGSTSMAGLEILDGLESLRVVHFGSTMRGPERLSGALLSCFDSQSVGEVHQLC